jgi:light-regulated signal transduction histidine kinase (bacteriophytochrome)
MISSDVRVLGAALQTMVNERYQRAYLHDVRGGLQAISGAFELLSRLARAGQNDPAVVDRASNIAKRALANHESAIFEMVTQITSDNEASTNVDLGELLDDILRFLRNDLATRRITVEMPRAEPVTFLAQKYRVRLLLLGLLAQMLDDSAPDSILRILLTGAGGSAVVEISGSIAQQQPAQHPSGELVFEMACEWLSACGGRLERKLSADRKELRLEFP